MEVFAPFVFESGVGIDHVLQRQHNEPVVVKVPLVFLFYVPVELIEVLAVLELSLTLVDCLQVSLQLTLPHQHDLSLDYVNHVELSVRTRVVLLRKPDYLQSTAFAPSQVFVLVLEAVELNGLCFLLVAVLVVEVKSKRKHAWLFGLQSLHAFNLNVLIDRFLRVHFHCARLVCAQSHDAVCAQNQKNTLDHRLLR